MFRPALSLQLDAKRHLLAVDPVLAPLIERHGPCPLGTKRPDPFHTLCRSIVSQQLSSKAADCILERVAQRLGAKGRFRPEHFRNTTESELRACGLSRAKARWLLALVEQVSSKALSFAHLRSLPDEEAIEVLDALPGIGRWTAEMFLIFALQRPDVFAMEDAGLRRAINRLYGNGRRVSDRRVQQISRVWAPYRSVASWYLWRSLEAPVDGHG